MIRRFSVLLTLVLAVAVLATVQVSAQQSIPITNEHIQRIKDNCRAADGTLTQLHASDALLRVNRGQLYDLISTKLMARMNSRLAMNRLDASRLISVTANFDRTLNDFRSHYRSYEERLSATLRIDCRQKPVEFYESVRQSRELREKVNQAVRNLGQYIVEYDHEFETFRTNFRQSNNGAKS